MEEDKDEQLSFISLAAATANVVQYLQKQKIDDGHCKPDPGSADEQKRNEQLQYIEHRLRQIKRFERSFSRKNGSGRKTRK
jgi:hypothetical protein